MKALVAQTKAEVRLTLRRGESLLVSLLIPGGLLVFLSKIGIGGASGKSVDFYLPASITAAIMASSWVSLSIATGYERHYGVLKRLGSTPLGTFRLLSAKSAAVLIIETLQVILLVGIAALFLNWSPRVSVVPLVSGVLLGTSAFAGIGLFLAGSVRAEANLAITNALFVLLLLVGGIVIPDTSLPHALSAVAKLLPSGVLLDWVRWGLGGPIPKTLSFGVLALWGIGAVAAAAATFRWD